MLSTKLRGPLSATPVEATVPEAVQRQIQIEAPYGGVAPNEIPGRVVDQLSNSSPDMVRPAVGPTGSRALDVAPITAAPTDTSPPGIPEVGLKQFDPEALGDNRMPGSNVNLTRFDPEEMRNMGIESSLRLAEPTAAPDFSSPDIAFENITNARNQIQGSMGYGVDNKSYKGNNSSLGDESSATNLNYYAEMYKAPIMAESGIWKNPEINDMFENVFGLNETNMESLPSTLMLASSAVFQDVQLRNYEDNIGDEADISGMFDDRGQSLVTSKTDETMGDIRQIVSADPNSQPIVQAVISGYVDKLSAMSSRNPQSATGAYVKRQIPREMGVAMLKQAMDEGYLTFAKNKDGIFYPILTTKGDQQRNTTLEAAGVYDIETRALALKEPLIRAQAFPTVNNEFLGKQRMFVKGRYVGDKDKIPLNEVSIQLQNGVALQVDPGKRNILKQLANLVYGNEKRLQPLAFNITTGDSVEVSPENPSGDQYNFVIQNAYSDSFAATSIANFSRDIVEAKVKELLKANKKIPEIVQIITTINKNKIDQIEKHLNDYLANNGLRYVTHKISPSTLRIFVTATDTNHGNHSGTVRPAIRFGVRYSARVPNNTAELLSRTKRLANGVFNTKGLRGIENGTFVDTRLKNMAREDLVMLDAIYQIGKTANKYGISKLDTIQPTEIDFINSVDEKVMTRMAKLGTQFKMWEEGNLPLDDAAATSTLNDIGVDSLADLFEKKEWADPMSNAIMASDIANKIQTGGGVVELAGTIEHDATQSNAAIMSMVIGDMRIANILKIYVGGNQEYGDLKESYKDLRGLVSSSLLNDIDLALRGPDESIKKEALKKYFTEARGRLQNTFDKAYGRGIVVAGLYGKSPLYMFTEAENMIASIGRSDEFVFLESLYKNKPQELLEDISSIYSMSMYNHLNNLKGFQQVTSSIGSIKAIYDGSSEIDSFFGTKLSLDYSYATHTDDEKNNLRNIPGLPEDIQALSGRATGLTAPRDVNASMADRRDRALRTDEINEGIPEEGDKLSGVSSFGGKAAIALPVVLIQSGDSAQNSATNVYINQDREGEPLNYYSTHDAQHTAPGSTLLAVNAYNNITPYLLANESKTIIDSLVDSMKADRTKAFKDIADAGGEANIGLRGKYKSVTGVLDTMFANSQMKSRDELRNRKPLDADEAAYFARLKVFNNKILSLAAELGWLPPTKRNEGKRDNIKLDLESYKEITRLIEASRGFIGIKESLPDGLGEVPGAKSFAIKTVKKLNFFQNANEVMKLNMASNNNRFYNSK